MKRAVLLFIMSIMAIFLFLAAKSRAQWQASPYDFRDFGGSSPWPSLYDSWNYNYERFYSFQNFYNHSLTLGPYWNSYGYNRLISNKSLSNQVIQRGNQVIQSYNFIPDMEFFSFDYKTSVLEITYDNNINHLSYPSSFLQPKAKPRPKIIPTSISLSQPEINFYCLNQTKPITANLTYSDNSSEVITTGLSFYSKDPNIVSVNEDGLVTAIREGSTIITANYGSLSSAGIEAKVLRPISFDILSLYLEPNIITLTSYGQSEQLVTRGNYEITFSDMSKDIWLLITDRQTSFVSSDTNVASVDNKGKVTALHNGSAVITATQDGLSDSVYVTVALSGLTCNVLKILGIKASSLNLEQNEQTQLACLVKNPNPEAILTYEWYQDGQILPLTEANISWKAPMAIGVFQLCCKVSNNYGEEDTFCREISVGERMVIGLPFLELHDYTQFYTATVGGKNYDFAMPYTVRASQYFILGQPNFQTKIPSDERLFFSCNIGTVVYKEQDDILFYFFHTMFPGQYLIQITVYSDSVGAYTDEFIFQVLPVWAIQ